MSLYVIVVCYFMSFCLGITPKNAVSLLTAKYHTDTIKWDPTSRGPKHSCIPVQQPSNVYEGCTKKATPLPRPDDRGLPSYCASQKTIKILLDLCIYVSF